ncbi:hypothetical protein TVAG_058130 [Trichomonas vaginalis G3]|uniref:Uncharacterized protein n=1 Tax=Trichomonas vaginalis (strain ATCC PRA-98 / G3) TaxID=412133 RepID=A2EQ73_TRIV3|nr:hypothetical protein TVAGG3_0586410 [Trichomonas vaginalis G3]EAY05156.1 hypothetical protein TVAG_058130 [Trichomonas vaginalis G3]KAI5522926.1 hypothetical protein TVAGG3_0586410 [Trichomonas vaginalis G3]|eukprot:XP_001317379.1 hypothetical protein [Trichomonas vaginalis G3]
MSYEFDKITNINNRKETKEFKEILAKIQKCRKIMKRRRSSSNAIPECQAIVTELLANTQYPASFVAYIHKELDTIIENIPVPTLTQQSEQLSQ